VIPAVPPSAVSGLFCKRRQDSTCAWRCRPPRAKGVMPMRTTRFSYQRQPRISEQSGIARPSAKYTVVAEVSAGQDNPDANPEHCLAAGCAV